MWECERQHHSIGACSCLPGVATGSPGAEIHPVSGWIESNDKGVSLLLSIKGTPALPVVAVVDGLDMESSLGVDADADLFSRCPEDADVEFVVPGIPNHGRASPCAFIHSLYPGCIPTSIR